MPTACPSRFGPVMRLGLRPSEFAVLPPYERCLGVSYTNRWLGNFAIWLSICELLGDEERFELARQHFNHFYDVNMTRGFPERLSMTYYMVDIIAMGIMLKYVNDPAICFRVREMLSIFVQELLFFEDRQPVPARRTYNQHTGAALKWLALDWVLGVLPDSPQDFATIVNNRGPHGFVEDGGWLTVAELATRDVVDPAAFVAPAPRQMRGRHVDEIGYTSYFHQTYTLGTFDCWPPAAVGAGPAPCTSPDAYSRTLAQRACAVAESLTDRLRSGPRLYRWR